MTHYSPTFQVTVLQELREALASVGFVLIDVSWKGESERYIVASIAQTNLKVFLYEDGAEVSGPDKEIRCEWQAYDSEQLLKADFVRRAVQMAKDSAAC